MRRALLPAALIFLWADRPALATLTTRLSIEELAERSERIVQGRCIRTWSSWDAERQFIWTHSEILVSSALKGGRTAAVVVSEPGGAVDGVEMTVEGMPRYQPGEELVLFLYRTPVGLVRSRGLAQGRFQVASDPAGSRIVRQNLQGAVVVDSSGAASFAGRRLLDGMPLEAFLSTVRGILAGQGGGR